MDKKAVKSSEGSKSNRVAVFLSDTLRHFLCTYISAHKVLSGTWCRNFRELESKERIRQKPLGGGRGIMT